MVLRTFLAPLPLACSVGHSMPRDSDVVPGLEIAGITEALRKHLRGTHSHALHCPRVGLSVCWGCQLHLPSLVLTFSKRRQYRQLPVSGRRMQRFLQFRFGSHNLPIVAGQFSGD